MKKEFQIFCLLKQNIRNMIQAEIQRKSHFLFKNNNPYERRSFKKRSFD